MRNFMPVLMHHDHQAEHPQSSFFPEI